MQGYWAELFTLMAVFGLAVLSPGPDFVVAVRNALSHGRRAGLWTAFGFGLGVLVHVTYTLLGIAALIAKSIFVFNIIKYMGAAYLIYMGIKALRSQGVSGDPIAQAADTQVKKGFTAWDAVLNGFITNALNPKACLFFLALFTQIIDPHMPHLIKAVFGLTCAGMVTIWFSIVAFVLTTPRIRQQFLKAAKWIDRSCGAVFIALGLKLALTKAPTP